MSEIINILVASRYDENLCNILTVLSEQNDFIIASVEKDEAGVIIKSERLKPNVVIIDLQPSALDIFHLASIIKRKTPSTSIILICDIKKHDIIKALKTGVMGVLSKEADTDEMIIAIKAVNKGGFYSSTPYINFEKQTRISKNLLLSPAEQNVISCITKGLSNNEIAEHLNYSNGTIRNIIADIRRKTKLKNRVQIAVFSLINGLISLENLDIYTDRQFP